MLLGAASEEAILELGDRVRAHVEAPRFARSFWGIKVVSLETGRVWFDLNGNKLLKPASNAKLFTAALVLDRFGPEHRFRTGVYRRGKISRTGTLRGDLIVYGRGDPSWAARYNAGNHELSMGPLTEAIRQAGIKRITGDLVGDESYFQGEPFGHGWTWDDLQYYYGAQVSALTAEDNVVDLKVRPGPKVGARCVIDPRPSAPQLILSNLTVTVDASGRSRIEVGRGVGSGTVYIEGQMPRGASAVDEAVTVPDPGSWFLFLLEEDLRKIGIKVEGERRTIGWRRGEGEPGQDRQLVAEVEGRTVSEHLARMLKPSQNLYAQLLLLAAGASLQQEDASLGLLSTEQAGLIALRRFLSAHGIDASEVLLEEGSGLSRGGLVTPNAIVALLRLMDGHRWGEVFRQALPVAGRDGTLRRRFVGTPAEGQVEAKTGTLRYVNALGGYTVAGSGERLAFSLMLNNHRPGPDDPAPRDDLDTVVMMLRATGAAAQP